MAVLTPARSSEENHARVCNLACRCCLCPARRAADSRSSRAAAGLLEVLAGVSDLRARRGVHHRLVTVLAVSACAVRAGARFLTAIAEWVADLPAEVRVVLDVGTRRDVQQAVPLRAIGPRFALSESLPYQHRGPLLLAEQHGRDHGQFQAPVDQHGLACLGPVDPVREQADFGLVDNQ
jgi:hypothetical protein